MTNDGRGGSPARAAPPPPVDYPAYGPPGYPQYPGYPPPALKPGIIPLRPLGLSDILNAALLYIRVNPKATLGLTTIVVIISQLIGLVLTAGVPLILYGHTDITRVEDGSEYVGIFLGMIATGVTSGLVSVLLSGMLTVIVGRAVFGATITVRETWHRVRGRVPALLGLAVIEGVGAAMLATVAYMVVVVAVAISPILGVLVGVFVVAGVIAAIVFLWTILSFAPVLIVLERLPVFRAISRSFALVRGSFWRVFGIRVLGTLVAMLVAAALAGPFTIVGQLLEVGVAESVGVAIGASVLLAVGGAIGQIITAPFTAGLVVLLYTDRRIRAEAFDLVLQTAAAAAAGDSADATDHLWLIRQP